MPKRRRLLTPMRNKPKKEEFSEEMDKELTPRGRLKGALLEVLEPAGEESDDSVDQKTSKRESGSSQDFSRQKTPENDKFNKKHPHHHQSYVLKLFDRSVDLSQFNEDSPLYPICRAWIANQPKANYNEIGKRYEEPEQTDDGIELPGPEGPPISRIPSLLPEQRARNKLNINLNYREAPPPSKEQLLQSHVSRWAAVRRAWLEQGAKVEARYTATQHALNKLNANTI